MHFKCKATDGLKENGWIKIQHTKNRHKKVGVATWISDKADFKTKSSTRNKATHFIIISVNSYIPQHVTVIKGFTLKNNL